MPSAKLLVPHRLTPPPQAETTVIVPDKNALLLLPLEELHDLPINPSPPKPAVVKLNAWTGNPIHLPCKSRWASFCLSPSTSNNFIRVCKQKGQSVTSVLSSLIAAILFRNLASFVGSLTCIIPVNLRPWLKVPPNAIGTYFDAITAQFTRPDQIGRDLLLADIRAGAQKSLNSDKRLPLQRLPAGQHYTSVANFRSVPDIGVVFNSLLGSPRDAAFEVTNAGLYRPATTPAAEESASFWEIEKVLPSRSAAAAGAAITVSVATGGSGVMGLGFSWQQGVVGDSFVEGVRLGIKWFFDIYERYCDYR